MKDSNNKKFKTNIYILIVLCIYLLAVELNLKNSKHT